MQRATGLTAMLSVKEGVHMNTVDLEEHHEEEEVDIDALLRKIESIEADSGGRTSGKAPGVPSVPGSQTHKSESVHQSSD